MSPSRTALVQCWSPGFSRPTSGELAVEGVDFLIDLRIIVGIDDGDRLARARATVADCGRPRYHHGMSHAYDASTKYLVQNRLADWLPLCGRTTSAELRVIDADLSTVTAAADRVLWVGEDPSGCFTWSCNPAEIPICFSICLHII